MFVPACSDVNSSAGLLRNSKLSFVLVSRRQSTTAVVGGISLGQWIFSAAVTIVITKQIYDVIVRTPNKYPGDYTKLKNGQGYKDRDGNIWKKDQLHKDHWDVSNKKGEKVKEVDYNGKQIWPGGAKNKNKK